MREQITAYLNLIPAAPAHEIASDLGLGPREVQDMLVQMDEDGTVIMRQGWYRLSEAYKAGLVKK